MRLNTLNVALVVVLVATTGLAVLIHSDMSRRNYEIRLGADMTYSPAYDGYSKNPNFNNGRTMQDPVVGTIARGARPLHFQPTPEGAAKAAELLENPHRARDDSGAAVRQRGSEMYQVFCVACHGSGGTGDGMVAKRGFPPPPSLLTGKSAGMKDGQLFHIITYGQASMPGFAAQIPPDDRWAVITYIRSLQEGVSQRQAPPANSPEETKAP